MHSALSILQFGRTVGSWSAARARSMAGRSFGRGTLAGLCAVSLGHNVHARFGGGLPMMTGLLAAIGLSLVWGTWCAPRLSATSRWPALVAALIIAGWVLAFAPLSDAVAFASRTVDVERLASTGVQCAAGFAIALVLLGAPTACGAWLIAARTRFTGTWTLAGTAAGLLIAGWLIGPIFGIQWAGRTAAVLIIAAAAFRFRHPHCIVEFGTKMPSSVPNLVALVAVSLVVGLAAGALGRYTQQLFVVSEAVVETAIAGLLLGAGTASAALGRRKGRTRELTSSAGPIEPSHDRQRRSAAAWMAVCAATWCGLCLTLFPTLTDLFLLVTSSVSSVVLLMFIRGTTAAVLLLPLGLAWGAMVALTDELRMAGGGNVGRQHRQASWLPGAAALLAGVGLSRWLLSSGIGVPAILSTVAICLMVTSVALAWNGRWSRPNWKLVAAALPALGLVAAAATFHSYDPARAARLLFSTNVFMARAAGTDPRLLPFIDDARLVVSKETDRGTLTLWRYRGVQFQLRQSGVPKGVFCARPDVCPQYSGEVMPAALPLMLHEAPRHVLMLGLGSGSTLSACLEFPVIDVTCLVGDRAVLSTLEKEAWRGSSNDPRADNRVKLLEVEPLWAAQARGGSYDVAISDTDQPGTIAGGPYFTREYYQGIARQLAAGGLLAQRFQQFDFGPWPVISALATLKSVFNEVAAIETGPGEIVLLATNSPSGLSPPGLMKRLRSPQVGRVLGQLGWDWSVAVNLAAYSAADCGSLIKSSRGVNSAANGLFAYGMPAEMARWASKPQELAQTLGPHAARIAQWPGVDGNEPELLRRLSDVTAQRMLMTAYPDQPWAYRKVVRDDLKQHPRSVIEQIAAGLERTLHPVDQRRVDYLAALGQAVQEGQPRLERLRHLEEFADPYDPLLTYFLHHELVALYARAAVPDRDAELRHRLHAVYYSDSRDRSVRDVVDALQVIASQSESRAAARWDRLNGLLETLRVRWGNRGFSQPSSPHVMLIDLEKSITAVETAFAVMDRIHADAGVSAGDWQNRRDFVERSLVRPLRTYRVSLIPYYQKEANRTADVRTVSPVVTPSAN